MSGPVFASRVDQLDASIWNEELYMLISAQFKKSLQHLPISFIAHYEPDCLAFLKFVFLVIPFQTLRATIAQEIINLRYVNANGTNESATRQRLHCFAVCEVLFPWLWERIVKRIMCRFGDEAKRLQDSIESRGVVVYKLLTLINFGIFLQNSSYPTVIQRLFNIKLAYAKPPKINEVPCSNYNRELLWNEFSELLVFTLPLINTHRIKGAIKRAFKISYKKQSSKSEHNMNCGICGENPVLPHEIGCSHVFCYYCISSRVAADPQFCCVICCQEAFVPHIKPFCLRS